MLLWSLNLTDSPNLKEWHEPVKPAAIFRLTGIVPQNYDSILRWLEKERHFRSYSELEFARNVGEGDSLFIYFSVDPGNEYFQFPDSVEVEGESSIFEKNQRKSH